MKGKRMFPWILAAGIVMQCTPIQAEWPAGDGGWPNFTPQTNAVYIIVGIEATTPCVLNTSCPLDHAKIN